QKGQGESRLHDGLIAPPGAEPREEKYSCAAHGASPLASFAKRAARPQTVALNFEPAAESGSLIRLHSLIRVRPDAA
ncbi:MAG: hypothetical protein ACKOTE_10540, partial [Opitutaceae bacterium]